MKSKELIQKFRLPGYIAGKSFADASKTIDKKFEGRNDMISRNTKNELLKRLSEAQEHLKLLNTHDSNAYFAGGATDNLLDGANTLTPAGVTQTGAQLPTADVKGLGIGANTSGAAASVGGGSGMVNDYGGAVGAVLGGIGTGLSASKKKDAFYDPIAAKADSTDAMVGGAKDAAAAVIGPWGALFRGVEKLGQGAGDAIGGDTGNYVTSAFSPDEAIMRNNADPDVSVGDKLLGTLLPFHAAKISRKSEQRRQEKMANQNALRINSQFNDNFAYGGPMEGTLGDSELTADLAKKYRLSKYPAMVTDDSEAMQPVIDPQGQLTTMGTMNAPIVSPTAQGPSTLSKVGKFAAENYGSALRYAPVVANALQLSKLKRADAVRYNTSTARMNPEVVDEAQLQRIADQEMNNQLNRIQNSGGSEGAIRNAILASGVNKGKVLSDSYLKATDMNADSRQRAFQVNESINQSNNAINNRAIDEGRADAGAYESEKSRLIGQIGTDIGNIGKEQLFKQYPRMMGLGYDWNGRYFTNNKTGDKKTAEEAKAFETATNKKANGGYLSKSTMSHINSLYKK